MARSFRVALCLVAVLLPVSGLGSHSHGISDRVGNVSFLNSCAPAVQQRFNRGVALLHSFAYAPALAEFQEAAQGDPHCAMAHWGAAMTYYHQLWDPPLSEATIPLAQREIEIAQSTAGSSTRERQFITALAVVFQDAQTTSYTMRAQRYETAMRELARKYPNDPESQTFYALALLANADPADKNHSRQKQALAVLEPLYRKYPQHPGIAHYIIHASDNAELASQGLPAARAYASIAPAAPHALHMPSHIFTRLGLWDDSIASNLAAREAAHRQGDIGEELHAMDYLVYAYLQAGRYDEAGTVIQQLGSMPGLDRGNFKVGYAATAMPIRFAVERERWADAAGISLPQGAPPHVAALAVWARGLGLARTGKLHEAQAEAEQLEHLQQELAGLHATYWSVQTEILRNEVLAWIAEADGDSHGAAALLRACADQEDGVEKLPVTPGPVLPAREQLGWLLLEQHEPAMALKEFRSAIANAPGRRGAVRGESLALQQLPPGHGRRR